MSDILDITPEKLLLMCNSLSARGRSDRTIRAYFSDLRCFLRELEVNAVNKEEFEETAMNWLQSNRRRVAPKTTGRRLTSLKAYARWAKWGPLLDEYIPPVPAKGIPHPLPEGIDGIYRLISVARSEQHKALIALCGLCGCRIGEALSVRPADFNLTEMTLRIRGKGDKTRIVPIGSHAWEILQSPVTRAFIDGGTEVVGLKDRFARRVVTSLGVRAGLRRSIASHDLRATFGTEIYNQTLDVRLVQELLGHANVATTELYTGIDSAKMRAAVEGL